MNRFPHRVARRLVVIVGAIATSLALSAHAEEFDPEGKYDQIKPIQATETEGKVEVVDVFWFGCSHCFDFLSVMEDFEKNKPEYIEIRRMPAIFRKSWINHARAFYTAKVLGVGKTLHRPLFEAIHEQRRKLSSKAELMAFFESYGVDKEDFKNTFESFAVETQIRKSLKMQEAYGVRGTPSIIINGKYRTSGSLAGSYRNVIKVIEALAAKEKPG